MQKSFVDLQLAFIPDSEPTKVVQPGQSALNYPAMTSQLFATLNPTSRDARSDPSFSQVVPTSSEVVPLISVQLHRSLASASLASTQSLWFLDRLDGIHNLDEHLTVMYIG